MPQAIGTNKLPNRQINGSSDTYCLLHTDLMVAHTGLEPVISALRGQRVNQLHQCAVVRIIEAAIITPQVAQLKCAPRHISQFETRDILRLAILTSPQIGNPANI